MHYKNSIVLAVILLIGITTVSAQEKPDARLVKNRGRQAEVSFRYNQQGYRYFLFELDESHFIAAKSSLTKEEKQLLRPATEFRNAEGTVLTQALTEQPDFNFYDFGIRLQSDKRLYIALDKRHVLVFYSIQELTKLFSTSPGNTK